MTERHWSYDAADAEEQGEAPSFSLFGERFVCEARLPARALRRLAAVDLAVGLPEQTERFCDFVVATLADPATDEPRLAALIEAQPKLSFDALVSLSTWLMQTLTGRPTQPSLGSHASQSSDGPTSRVVSLSPATEAPAGSAPG